MILDPGPFDAIANATWIKGWAVRNPEPARLAWRDQTIRRMLAEVDRAARAA